MYRVKTILLATGLAAVLGVSSASAANLSLNGVIASTCALTLGSAGLLASSADAKTLSSESGGLAANATFLTTGSNYQVQIDPVSSLAVAPSGGQPDSMSSAFTATGVTQVLARATGTPLDLNVGLTNVDVNVTAQKSSSIFPAGIYRADVTLRCVSH